MRLMHRQKARRGTYFCWPHTHRNVQPYLDYRCFEICAAYFRRMFWRMFGVFFGVFSGVFVWRAPAYFPAYFRRGGPSENVRVDPRRIFPAYFCGRSIVICRHLRTKKKPRKKAGGCGTRFGRRPGDGVATPQRGAGVLGPPGAAGGPGDAGGLRGPPMGPPGPPRDRRGAAEGRRGRHGLPTAAGPPGGPRRPPAAPSGTGCKPKIKLQNQHLNLKKSC